MTIKRFVKIIFEVVLLNELLKFCKGFIDGWKIAKEEEED